MIKRAIPVLPLFGSVIVIGIGWAAVAATAEYSELGALFPKTVGALMVALGFVYLVQTLMGRSGASAPADGSNLRRFLLMAVMLGWSFSLEWLGFLPSSAAAQAALLLIAQHVRWTFKKALTYGVSTAFVLLALYALFKHALQVPLP